MKYSLLLLLLIFSCKIIAQKNKSANEGFTKHGIVISSLALLEPNATLDFGYLYSIKSKHKVLFDAGLLLPFNFYKGELPFDKGFRILGQYRKYNNKSNFFYGLE